MQVKSFLENVNFGDKNVSIDVMMDNKFTKEIRIVFGANQIMKEHKSKYPITLMCLEGRIKFSTKEEKVILNSGDMISLNGNIMHELEAIEPSVARLSLSKSDDIERVKNVLLSPLVHK